MSYATVADVRSWLAVHDSIDDYELSAVLEACVAAVDTHCGYGFGLDANATARVFAASSRVLLDVARDSSPIGTTSGLIVVTDEDGDGTFETTWASTDWQTEPLNGRGPGGAVWPVTALRAIGDRRWPVGTRAMVRVTARWGWPAVPNRVRLATIMLCAAWHQRRATLTGRSGFDGFFVSTIADDDTISDLLAPFRHGAHSDYGLG